MYRKDGRALIIILHDHMGVRANDASESPAFRSIYFKDNVFESFQNNMKAN